ncbi:rCG61438 [Rattus norvegicus]|uniref:RCG61438 n=1 Tax=Rattus norvegicus TaxID=10116 RepID=A6H9W7_RAT|nr:rCG61438 [Rattus norvegicus]
MGGGMKLNLPNIFANFGQVGGERVGGGVSTNRLLWFYMNVKLTKKVL